MYTGTVLAAVRSSLFWLWMVRPPEKGLVNKKYNKKAYRSSIVDAAIQQRLKTMNDNKFETWDLSS